MTSREARRERVLLDVAVPAEHGNDRTGHLGVIGPLPRRRWQPAMVERRAVAGDEELRAQRVPQREAPQRGGGARVPFVGHRRHPRISDRRAARRSACDRRDDASAVNPAALRVAVVA
jgi:hypothetical protein